MKKVLLAALVFSLFSPLQASADEAATPSWLERVNIYGTVEGDFVWTEHSDVMDMDSESVSDLLVSTVELGLDIEFNKTVTGVVILKAEDLGTGDETDVFVDEATLTITHDRFPCYLTAGKRVVPFGTFEGPLVSDPMGVDAYETGSASLTVGYAGPMDSDVSLTVYSGEEQMDHLFDSGLFDSDAVARAGEGTDGIESYVVAATVSPVQKETYGLTLFGGFLSEPGRGERNNTVNAGLSFTPFVIPDLEVYLEYTAAIQRENYGGLSRAYEESVTSVTVAYPIASVGVALRYEFFDDDGMTDEAGVWTVQDRYGIAGSYTIYESDAVETFVAAEYRRTNYRLPQVPGSMASSNDEVVVRLGASF